MLHTDTLQTCNFIRLLSQMMCLCPSLSVYSLPPSNCILLTNMKNSRNQTAAIRSHAHPWDCVLSAHIAFHPSGYIWRLRIGTGHFQNAIFTHHVLKNAVCHKTDYIFAVNVHCGGKKDGSQWDGGDDGGVIGTTLIKVRCMRLYESENINQESV